MAAHQRSKARLALGAALALSFAGCGNKPAPSLAALGSTADWDVLVVVLDALPANRLSIHGFHPDSQTDISPHIASFAATGTTSAAPPSHQSITFERAFAPASYTLASTASLFTGTNPATHGVLGLSSNVLSPKHRTLAEALQKAGFATCALTANPNVSAEGKFDQGFDTFRHYFRDDFKKHVLPATFIADAGAWWLHASDKRRFLYAHLLPPHQPYTSPAPHAGLFGADTVERIEVLTPSLTELSKRRDLTPQTPEVQRIEKRYNASVHYADTLLAELLRNLAGEDGHGLDKTLIVVTSDHGEAFAQHGQILHGGGVHEEFTRVPLVIGFPGTSLETKRFEPTISTTNLAPTLCQILDVAWPGESKGTSFAAPLLNGTAPGIPAISRSMGDKPVWSLRTDDYLLIEHRGSDSLRLFDLKIDPGETRDIAAQEPEITKDLAAKLKAALEQARQAGRAFPSGNTPELHHKDALEAIGYFD